MATTLSEEISPRNMLLLAMLARGHTTDRAARELRLSRYTVGEEISVLLKRFNCKNRAELVAFCYVYRLLPVGIWPPPYGRPDAGAAQDVQPARRAGSPRG
jgi:DNA-binding CsgD family transcriptional regulator